MGLRYGLRAWVIFLLAGMCSLALFGLLLGLFWIPLTEGHVLMKSIAAALAAVLAVSSGGSLIGLTHREAPLQHGALFGFVMGVFSLGYIFGLVLELIPLLLGFGGVGLAGAWLVRHLIPEVAEDA